MLSCDDPPTAPEEAQAATTAQETSTPQAAKELPWQAPAPLSGAIFVERTLELSAEGNTWPGVYCPDGTIPVSGGYHMFDFIDPMFDEWRLTANGPIRIPAGQGWVVGIQKLCGECFGDGDEFTLTIWAACVDADFAN